MANVTALPRSSRTMPTGLNASIGGYSSAGAKSENQDFHGSLVPEGALLASKGIALAIADGISSSAVAAIASETAVKTFLSDYYATTEAWSVRTSGEKVIGAANSWLYAQSGRSLRDEDRDRGHICTFTALVLKSRTAHIFHVGDTRVARLSGGSVEPLTREHRVAISRNESYLARALGADSSVEIEYRTLPLREGDIFLLTTDGVHEHVPGEELAALLARSPDLDSAARAIADRALENGSDDNLTVQIVRVETLPEGAADELLGEGRELPPAPLLQAGQEFEGFEIVREIHGNNRSHIYLARDRMTGERVALKVPSTELRADPDHMRRFMLEEWIARRIDSPHVLKAHRMDRPRNHLFVAMEYVDGISLEQWMRDHPSPSLESVRNIVEQIAAGLYAFRHREMLHQDLRPANILIDRNGTARIIDFGSTWVAGIAEAGLDGPPDRMLGTVQYSAPEYLLGEAGDERSDLFSVGVITYQMLTGQLPFGARRVEAGNPKALKALRYTPANLHHPAVPDWVDAAICRAVSPERRFRYPLISEFVYDLRHPNPRLSAPEKLPLLQRDRDLKWKLVIVALIAMILALGWQNHRLSERIDSHTSPAMTERTE